MGTQIRVLWAGLLWLWAAGFAWAQTLPLSPPAPPAIILEKNQAGTSIAGQARSWLDVTSMRTVDEVEAAGESLGWTVHQHGQQYRIDNHALWLRFDAIAPAKDRWYLELASSGLDRAQLFYRDSIGRWVVQEAGDSKPVSQWALPGRVPTFELSEQLTTPVGYWLRVEHARVNFAVPVAIYSQSALMASREAEQFLLGGYFGLALLIALVAAANGIAFRDRNFGAFALYVLAMSAGQVASLGVGAQHLWDDWLRWNEVATFGLTGVSAAVGLWFVHIVTEPARFSRVLEMAVWSLVAVQLGAVATDIVIVTRESFTLVMVCTVLVMVMVATLIGLVWKQGSDPHIRMFALGFIPLLIMATFPLARGFNLIPSSPLTRYGLSIGAAIEMPILFYALSLRGNRRREAKVRAAALSNSDALTGLADTRLLMERLESMLHRARTQKHACAILAVKLSNLDTIAADFDQDTAERALVVAASALRHVITDIDLAARVGERDFVLLLEGPTSTANAIGRAQQLVAKGLQQSEALPPSAALKFQLTVAMLPDRDYDAATSLAWVREAVSAMRPDTRRAIRPMNF